VRAYIGSARMERLLGTARLCLVLALGLSLTKHDHMYRKGRASSTCAASNRQTQRMILNRYLQAAELGSARASCGMLPVRRDMQTRARRQAC